MENTATSRVTVIAGYLKAPILGLVSGKDNRPKCPIKACRGVLEEFDIEPTDLGQTQWQCKKCFKNYLCVNIESLCANYKPTEKELSQWRIRVVYEQLKGFERLKLTDQEQQFVLRMRRGEVFYV
jgi:hypothetical protein